MFSVVLCLLWVGLLGCGIGFVCYCCGGMGWFVDFIIVVVRVVRVVRVVWCVVWCVVVCVCVGVLAIAYTWAEEGAAACVCKQLLVYVL